MDDDLIGGRYIERISEIDAALLAFTARQHRAWLDEINAKYGIREGDRIDFVTREIVRGELPTESAEAE